MNKLFGIIVSLFLFLPIINAVSFDDLNLTTSNIEQMCEKLFLFALEKGETIATPIELQQIREDLSFIIDINSLGSYLTNYNELCFEDGHYEELPSARVQIFILSDEQKINLELDPFFDSSIKLYDVFIGESTAVASFLKYFLDIEQRENQFVITGIRIWFVVLLLIALFLFNTLKTNLFFKSIIENKT